MGSSLKYTETERVSTVSPSLVATSVLREIPHRDEAFRKRQKGCQCKESVLVCGCVLFVWGLLFQGVLETFVSLAKVWMSSLVGKVVDGKEHRRQIPTPLAFCVTGSVEGSGDSQPEPGWCHAA